jgi:alpha-1,2-mannosyltransferase
MSAASRRALQVLILAALGWHAVVVAHHYKQAHRDRSGRDFASYYYAIQVAADGGDPYSRGALGAASREDQTRKGVHPYFYPPPFLLTMVWAIPLDLVTAYRAWFWLGELMTLLAGLVLWRWWRPLGPVVGVTIAVVVALNTGLPNNHLMGQANTLVMFATLLGLWAAERERPLAAGALLGLACMWKMAPALFVAWWLLRGRWRAAFASVGTAVLLSVASLPLVGFGTQVAFYTDVMPGFSSGNYNGLTVGIDLFGNHSLPNLFDAMAPSSERPHMQLSTVARSLSSLTGLALLGGLGWSFRSRTADTMAIAGQIGAIGVVMVLVPVITYEHHLVWVLPAVVACIAGIANGRLSSGWVAPVALASMMWCYELQELKDLYGYLRGTHPWLAVGIRELKFVALVTLLAASAVIGRSEGET